MPAVITFDDVVVWLHVTAVFTAFGALFAYPVFLGVNARMPIDQRAGFHRLQIAFSKRVTGPAIAVVLAAGIYLASDRHLWSKDWVTVPLVLLIVIAGMGVTVLRRNEERLVLASDAEDETTYASTLSVLRSWTLATVALIVLAIFFMTVKP